MYKTQPCENLLLKVGLLMFTFIVATLCDGDISNDQLSLPVAGPGDDASFKKIKFKYKKLPKNSVRTENEEKTNTDFINNEISKDDGFIEANNSIVIERGPHAALVKLFVFVEGIFITTIYADGLIVSVPSSGNEEKDNYSVRAGGPFVHPLANTILLTAICPHTLNFRPVLLPADVSIVLVRPNDGRSSLVTISADGARPVESGWKQQSQNDHESRQILNEDTKFLEEDVLLIVSTDLGNSSDTLETTTAKFIKSIQTIMSIPYL